jgi:hypothetical protein
MRRLVMLSPTQQDLRLAPLVMLSRPGMCRPMPWPFQHMPAKLSPQARKACIQIKMEITFDAQRYKVTAAA